MEKGILKIDGSAARKVAADGALLQCTIRGTSFIHGNVALRKTRELAELVGNLAPLGVPLHAFEVESVEAEGTGSISRASSATYVISIECDTLDNLLEIVGVINAQKSAQLMSVKWHYPSAIPATLWEEMLQECVSHATRRARSIARELGVELLGIRLFTKHESFRDTEARDQNLDDQNIASPLTEEELGLRAAHTKEFFLIISIEYQIAPLEHGAQPRDNS